MKTAKAASANPGDRYGIVYNGARTGYSGWKAYRESDSGHRENYLSADAAGELY